VVPVGEDQIQHMTFVMPKPKVLDSSARVPGLDGEKMSKSYNNTLAVFDDVKAQRKQIMRITTDCRPMEEPKDPKDDVLFDLYKLVATDAQVAEMGALYARGGFGYGEVKKALADAAEAFYGAARERRADWASRPDDVRDVLKAGAAKARAKAGATLARAQAACGIKGY
jgi:tryptophanyl-tRNA synthetase